MIMRDVFGTDQTGTEGNPGVPPTTATGGVMTATAPSPLATADVAVGPKPTLQQATDKAIAKAGADATVATDPHAVHAVKIAANSPKSLSSTGAGAAAGFLLGGPPGALLGAGLGFLSERYQIGGGPSSWWGKAVAKVKSITGHH
jgi:hypothetical protein